MNWLRKFLKALKVDIFPPLFHPLSTDFKYLVTVVYLIKQSDSHILPAIKVRLLRKRNLGRESNVFLLNWAQYIAPSFHRGVY